MESGPSSIERQKQTAAEIARNQVLASYQNSTSSNNTYKKAPIATTNLSQSDWQRYHSAWQNYYQKYYSEYYAKAAHQYLETKKLKIERERQDQERLVGATKIESADTNTQQIENSLRQQIRQKAQENLKNSRRRRHLWPILVGTTLVTAIIFLQYNRLLFAPIMAYIAPGNTKEPVISEVDPTITKPPGPEPKLIIPKLNIDVPVHFGISNDNRTVMNAMEHGVAQFAIPGAHALPGQSGNLVITGHSAGDIYSNNQYKFIFSGLERLQANDNIYINHNSTRYTYTITKFQTVEPTNVAALTSPSNNPQLILVTCTPLGTSRYRLLVYADQVAPNPQDNIVPPVNPSKEPTASPPLPANEPSFFDHIWNFLTGR